MKKAHKKQPNYPAKSEPFSVKLLNWPKPFKIYRRENGVYNEVYSHPTENDFYHAIISGKIKGELMFMMGSRKGAAELCLIRWDADAKAYVSQQIEAGPGPSNLALLNAASGDYLLSANRMIVEAAAYRF